jgi:hypothetical protein
VFPFCYYILRSIKGFNFYFNLNASPKCCRNVHVWNGDAKAQKQLPVCELEFRIFHSRQKLNTSTISFMSQNLSSGSPVKREGGDVNIQ